MEARRAHNPEVVGSSPASATIKTTAFAVVFLYFHNFLRRNGTYQNSFDTNSDTNAESKLVLLFTIFRKYDALKIIVVYLWSGVD